MKYFVDGKQMKMIDQTTIGETGIPSLILMEQAAAFFCDQVECFLQESETMAGENVCQGNGKDVITVIAGTGNNGADGLAAARILFSRGYKTEAYVIGNPDKATEEWKTQWAILSNLEISHYILQEEDISFENIASRLSHTALLADGIFGIGLTREVGGRYQNLIDILNRIKVPKAAIDIPSGIYAGTGQIAGCALSCDLTVTFGREKTGQHLYPGKLYCGKLVSAPLGFSPRAYEKAGYTAWQYDEAELAESLPKRPPDGHKMTFGKVLVIAGCATMAGAAVFSAKAAYRSGAGLVRVCTVRENRDVLLQAVPEAILTLYDPEDLLEQEIRDCLAWADAVVFGPGIGQASYVHRLLQIVLRSCSCPLVIDADGIRVLAADGELCRELGRNVILTPHIGEMTAISGLSGKVLLENPIDNADTWAKQHGCNLVMKSAVTVIAGPEGKPALEDRGCNALATAGSGDVLTGIIAAMAAGGAEPGAAAVSGCAVHAMAGRILAEGARSAMAGDLIDTLPRVFWHLEKQFT